MTQQEQESLTKLRKSMPHGYRKRIKEKLGVDDFTISKAFKVGPVGESLSNIIAEALLIKEEQEALMLRIKQTTEKLSS